jgi:hypothetical protein
VVSAPAAEATGIPAEAGSTVRSRRVVKSS